MVSVIAITQEKTGNTWRHMTLLETKYHNHAYLCTYTAEFVHHVWPWAHGYNLYIYLRHNNYKWWGWLHAINMYYITSVHFILHSSHAHSPSNTQTRSVSGSQWAGNMRRALFIGWGLLWKAEVLLKRVWPRLHIAFANQYVNYSASLILGDRLTS